MGQAKKKKILTDDEFDEEQVWRLTSGTLGLHPRAYLDLPNVA